MKMSTAARLRHRALTANTLNILLLILAAADKKRCPTIRELADASGITINGVYWHLRYLLKYGLVNCETGELVQKERMGSRTLTPSCRAVFFVKQKREAREELPADSE